MRQEAGRRAVHSVQARIINLPHSCEHCIPFPTSLEATPGPTLGVHAWGPRTCVAEEMQAPRNCRLRAMPCMSVCLVHVGLLHVCLPAACRPAACLSACCMSACCMSVCLLHVGLLHVCLPAACRPAWLPVCLTAWAGGTGPCWPSACSLVYPPVCLSPSVCLHANLHVACLAATGGGAHVYRLRAWERQSAE
jgi:hypothetical protein